jgi:hypothetical protein
MLAASTRWRIISIGCCEMESLTAMGREGMDSEIPLQWYELAATGTHLENVIIQSRCFQNCSLQSGKSGINGGSPNRRSQRFQSHEHRCQ